MKNRNVKIILTGDFVVNTPYHTSNLHDDVVTFFRKADFNIVNLEAPVTESANKIQKTGPHLRADVDATLGIFKTLNINVAALANNHIFDFGEEGVKDTISFCEKNHILHVGAGRNIGEAAKVLCLPTQHGNIGVINIAENEWASATCDSAGGNGMSLIENYRHIQQAREMFDYVFVIAHGGHEYYNLPSPRIKSLYRFFIDAGADMVIGHHPHCISGYEVYQGKHIYYSLGNFLFTKEKSSKDWYEGLILELDLSENGFEQRLIGIKHSQDIHKLEFVSDSEKDLLDSKLQKLNSIIVNEDLLRDSWRAYINRQYNNYLSLWSPVTFIKNRYLRAAARKLYRLFVNKSGYRFYLNLMKCEAHSDLSKEIIQKYLKG